MQREQEEMVTVLKKSRITNLVQTGAQYNSVPASVSYKFSLNM